MIPSTSLEKLYQRMARLLRENLLPLLSGLLWAFAAHGFVLSNKLLNADETTALFSKGATVDSGRWALELLRWVFPDVSVPWLWGLVSILFISLAACLTLKIFRIRHPFLQILLPGLFVSFPSLTGIFCFMFTSSAYALCFLLAVLAVYLFEGESRTRKLLAVAAMVFSLGIYQAYVALAASFFVLRMVQRLLEGEKAGQVFAFGLRALAMLVLSLLVYYGCSLLAVQLSGGGFLLYAFEEEAGLLFRLALAYNAFARSLLSGYFGFVNSPLSFGAHWLSLLVCLVFLGMELKKMEGWKRRGLALLCLGLLPLSMNCIFLISSPQIIHSLVLYSFVSLYVLAAILLERALGKWSLRGRDLLVLCMLLLVLNNVFFANKVYLKLHLQYENAHSFYTGLVTRIQMTEGYEEDTVVKILGLYEGLTRHEELDTGDFFGPSEDLVNIYTRDDFVKNYLGFDGQLEFITKPYDYIYDTRYQQMPAYPADGSLAWLDGVLVVKLG